MLRDPFCHLLIVTREHHASDVDLLEHGDGLLRLRPDDVGERDSTRYRAVKDCEYHCLSLGLQLFDAFVVDYDVV